MDEIEEIKRRINIVDFISQYLTLKKAGANYKAVCPFHEEKTPSFMVSPDKQIWKCFGCGKGGSVFDFVMEMEGLNFPEALELLANRAGVELKRTRSKEEYRQEKDIKTKLFQINSMAAEVFHKILLEHSAAEKARKYLKTRVVNDSSVKTFKIGYAPVSPVLYGFLKKRGFSDEEIRLSGSPEKFRNRLIFPILDVMGNCVGFSGRALEVGQEPKYINTPETPIFHKSRVIYGLDKAKTEVKKEKKSLIVEGQMDVILSHQVGVKFAVASSGTALTQDHLEILKRYSNDIIFAFDQDNAGTEAGKKALSMAIANEMNVKMVVLPEGFKDAGEAAAKDAKIWQRAVEKSISAIEWYFLQAFAKNKASLVENKKPLSVDDKKSIARELLPILKRIPDRIEQAHWLQILAKRLAVPERSIEDALLKTKSTGSKSSASPEERPTQKHASLEEVLIGLLIKFPEYLKKTITDLDYKDFTIDTPVAKIYKFLQSCYTKSSCADKKGTCDFKVDIERCLKNKLGPELKGTIDLYLLNVEEAYAQSTPDEIVEEIIFLTRQIKLKKRDKLKDDFAIQIKEAEEKGDHGRLKELLVELQKIISK